MAKEPAKTPTQEEVVDLKDAYVATFLAFVLPGLGHLYQGRTGKAFLYFFCIFGLFLMGVSLGSSQTFGIGRTVYCSLRPTDIRYAYFGQIWMGLPASGALIQYLYDKSGEEPLFRGAMAPPMLGNSARQTAGGMVGGDNSPNVPTKDNIRKRLGRRFELGTIFTVVAGLLNVFAVFDAGCGPMPRNPEEREKKGEKKEEKKEEKEEKEGKKKGKSSKKDI